MKRSEINTLHREAKACFENYGWALPPNPKWDITDFGLGRLNEAGLVLINLADEPEYCEKLMYARKGQQTPLHAHRQKKEDIICRHGRLALELWGQVPAENARGTAFTVNINAEPRTLANGEVIELNAGERITLTPGIYHAFWPATDDCIIGEVSTANDDAHDNFFIDPDVGRYPEIDEDEAAEVKLLSDQ